MSNFIHYGVSVSVFGGAYIKHVEVPLIALILFLLATTDSQRSSRFTQHLT